MLHIIWMKMCNAEGCSSPADKHRTKCRSCYQREYWQKASPEQLEKRRALGRACMTRARATPEHKKYMRDYLRFRNTGITPEMVEAFRELQGGKCAICTRAFSGHAKGAHAECADHCHTTKTPRGLLCATCNKSLGFYETHQKGRIVIAPYDTYIENTPFSVLQASQHPAAVSSVHEPSNSSCPD